MSTTIPIATSRAICARPKLSTTSPLTAWSLVADSNRGVASAQFRSPKSCQVVIELSVAPRLIGLGCERYR